MIWHKVKVTAFPLQTSKHSFYNHRSSFASAFCRKTEATYTV